MIRGTLDNRRRTPEQIYILKGADVNQVQRHYEEKKMLRPFTSQFVSEAEPKLTN